MTKSEKTNRWRVEDSDGAMFLLSRIGRSEAVLVEHNGERWVCSEDGPQPTSRTAPKVQCVHVEVVGSRLPLSVALSIASSIAASADKAKVGRGGRSKGMLEAERASARLLAAGQEKRAERAREHDSSFVMATPVVVRQMTDADRAKLEVARARKAKRYEHPVRFAV